MHILLVGYVALRSFRREPVPDEHHTAFSDALAATYTASRVYEEEMQHRSTDEQQ
jgi:hypothetical protein